MVQRIGMAVLSVLTGLAVLLVVRPAASAPTAQTIYVDPVNGSDTTGAGSLAAPWRSLKRALQSAVAGDTINALAGTYSTATGETFPINWLPGVKLSGAGRDVTVIQGQSDQPVIYIGSTSLDFYSDTVISGLAVQNGSVGIVLRGVNGRIVSPTFLDLRIAQNQTGLQLNMGAEYFDEGATIAPLISGTEVISNVETGLALNVYTFGNPSSAAPRLVNSLVRDNGGHGITLNASSPANTYAAAAPYLINSQVLRNGGHGIYATAGGYGSAVPHIERSWLSENTGFGFYWDGYVGTLDAAITNTVIARNTGGGIFFNVSSALRVVHSVIADNGHYGVYWNADQWNFSQPRIVNSILWNRNADDLYVTGRAWTTDEIQNSDIEDGDLAGQHGNFSADPQLIDDYHLGACSPAINAGTAALTASTDLDGEARYLGAAPDVGADEYEAPCVLQVHKTASTSRARFGDLITYTIQLTNTLPLTVVNVIVTDVLPTVVAFQPDSLQAAYGTAHYADGLITWQDVITPNGTATISLTGKVNLANTTSANRVIADAGPLGRYASPVAVTSIDPALCYLPLIQHNYCAGPSIDDFSNPASGWPIADTTYWSYGYTGGEYRFYANRSAFGAVSRGDKTGRFIVEVDARQVSATNGSFGLIFQLADDWSDLYTFEIFPATQQWAIFRNVNGQWSLLTYGSSSAIQPGYNTNRLRIAWLQQTVSFDDYGFYVNGQPVFSSSFIYAPTPVRRVGLTATSDGAGFEARFDNYKFVAQGCPESPAARVSGAGQIRTEQPLEQLPTVWQKRLRGENLSSGRTTWRQTLFSEEAR